MTHRTTKPLRLTCSAIATIAIAVGCRATHTVAPPAAHDRLAFRIEHGRSDNYFLREGDVAAHLVLTSGSHPRAIFAFPAGNSGIGLWLGAGREVKLGLGQPLEPVTEGGLRGVRATLTADVNALEVVPVLSNIRVLRDYTNGVNPHSSDPFPAAAGLPPEIVNTIVPAKANQPLIVRRTALDGHRFELRVSVQQGQATPEGARLRLTASSPLSITLVALTDYPSLGTLSIRELLKNPALGDPRDREALAFLSYPQKMLAGSWRYLTYFGRDTLLATCLLLPALRPEPIEGALAGVLDRLSASGEVAHEEDVGEWAALRHLRAGEKVTGTPVHDYKMVDDDFMLAILAARYFSTPEGAARAAKFLVRRTPDGHSYADALRTNLRFVIERAAPYAKSQKVADLVALKPGIAAGDWRDSNEGLGGGRLSYSINVGLVPPALAAAAELASGPLADSDLATKARSELEAWRGVGRHFDVTIPIKRARSLAGEYAKSLGLDGAATSAAIDRDLSFPALSLDAAGTPVPVMHTDDGFLLYFGAPDDRDLRSVAERLKRPFPAGLRTPLGIVVANGAYLSNEQLRVTFGNNRYHGAVIWSWQQALMAAGLARQLARTDLAPTTRADLVAAQTALWQVIETTRAVSAGELWSWKLDRGKFVIDSLGSHLADDESTAAQLWSTVYLAIPPPT